MGRARRKFTSEFKRKALKLCSSRGPWSRRSRAMSGSTRRY